LPSLREKLIYRYYRVKKGFSVRRQHTSPARSGARLVDAMSQLAGGVSVITAG
jgi:hypothetical protein